MSIEDLIPGFRPETDLERAVSAEPRLLRGLAWGRPRRGHPEGSVAAHVTELLAKLDEAGEEGERRADLRLVALVHDSFKFEVDASRPRTGENHHGMRARRFAERHVGDERLLSVIELHDRPYALWRRIERRGAPDEGRLDALLARVPDLDLMVRFVALDGSTEGKHPEPVRWFEEVVRRHRRGSATTAHGGGGRDRARG